MADLKLENDEGIIQQTNSVEMYKANDVYEEKIDNMNREVKNSMYCRNCGEKLIPNSKFCNYCGTPIDNTKNEENVVEEKKKETSTEELTERKMVYDGKIHKCPNCGELLKSFTTVCPACSYELRSVKTNSPVEELTKKIQSASLLSEKIELITNFYIPNTKEDIYDFFILAVSNLEDKWYDTDDAWRAKLEQAYQKARLSFGNTSEFEYLEKLYNKTIKDVNKRERGISTLFRRNKIACVTALLISGGILMIVIGVILLASTPFGENFGTSWGGIMFFILGINFLVAPTWVIEEIKEKKKNRISKKDNSNDLPIGKDAEEFISNNYEDMVEFLYSNGFKNVVTKAERKGILDTEGAIKGISIAGNTEFKEEDMFDKNSKIIIRYYSKNYKGG